MTDLWQTLKNTPLPIYLYGTGNGADKILDTLGAFGIKVSGVFVSDDFVRDKTFRGFKIQSYSAVKKECPSFIVVVCFGTSLPNVMSNIYKIAEQNTLLVPDLPVFGTGLFDLEFCKQNKNTLEKIYSLLADDISKSTFENLVKFKITGDLSYLKKAETSPLEPYTSFLNLSKDSFYVDLGAYRGDTLQQFKAVVGGYSKAIAVEPDKKTFEKLKIAADCNTTCVNAAVSDTDGVCYFEMKSKRGSHLSNEGKQIKSVTVDTLTSSQRPDFIKMDVEGAEALAISGATQTILRFKPKMQIAAYHRAFDLIDIVQKVLSIRPDYKVYLRHFPYIPAWDTNFYFI